MATRHLGDVIQLKLPSGRYAYGRVYRDASVAFYRLQTDEPAEPPVGSRDFAFVVGVHDSVMSRVVVVAVDPFLPGEDEWPPPFSIRDPISGGWSLYHHGEIRRSTPEVAQHMEPAAVWEIDDLIERLTE